MLECGLCLPVTPASSSAYLRTNILLIGTAGARPLYLPSVLKFTRSCLSDMTEKTVCRASRISQPASASVYTRPSRCGFSPGSAVCRNQAAVGGVGRQLCGNSQGDDPVLVSSGERPTEMCEDFTLVLCSSRVPLLPTPAFHSVRYPFS